MDRFRTQIRFFLPLVVLAALGMRAASVRAQSSGQLQVHITQVDTSAFPKVKVYVSVTDSTGEPTPVKLDTIQLYENSKRITPTDVSGIGTSVPLTTLLAVDISGSMNYDNKLISAKSAASAYVDQMRPGDEAGLLSFNTRITYVQPVTSDHDKLKLAIQGLIAGSDTAMYDALIQGTNLLKDVSGRKAIIVLTDGMDNRSKQTADGVIAAIGPSGLSISTIGLGDPTQKTGSFAGIDEPSLKNLAAQAGGSYGYVNDPAALQALYEQLGRTLQSEYAITYISPAKLRDGINRALSVKLADIASAMPAKVTYNPGGLVPEVAVSPSSSWPLFFDLLAALIVLLFVPAGAQKILALIPTRSTGESKPKLAAPRIRLQDAKPSRIKLK
ncbi:MAG: VWA domain-containing protein [Anaerolineales bacterium]|jgi:VWFA-related protein